MSVQNDKMDGQLVALMEDGVSIPFRFDGNPDPNAPVIVLCNPSLVDLTFWDDFLSAFIAQPQNQCYRLLRYNNRGRSKHDQRRPLTVEILTTDLITLLDTVKVARAAAMTGISLGAMTVLDLSLKHPERVAAIMPCDFFPESPPNNAANWNSRVDLAQRDKTAPKDSHGTRLVGQDVAEVMVTWWLSPKSLDGGLEETKIRALKKMVHDNQLDGLIDIAQVLSSYNLKKNIDNATVPAMFVAGRDDKPVISPMKHLVELYGKGCELRLIDDAGHLPVIDRPGEFARVFTSFLETN